MMEGRGCRARYGHGGKNRFFHLFRSNHLYAQNNKNSIRSGLSRRIVRLRDCQFYKHESRQCPSPCHKWDASIGILHRTFCKLFWRSFSAEKVRLPRSTTPGRSLSRISRGASDQNWRGASMIPALHISLPSSLVVLAIRAAHR